MIQNERETRHQRVMDALGQMMTAARTAPKAKGIDIIEIAVVEGNDIWFSLILLLAVVVWIIRKEMLHFFDLLKK